eukprot:gb/GECH01000898.1/.p1 GENE.gb/GECH01000898.1/~~gb/GECH01000898.1/.p1  ORF type:complete len:122 (+),score=21.17 gb/GECH01000898.1/:1-366(+)
MYMFLLEMKVYQVSLDRFRIGIKSSDSETMLVPFGNGNPFLRHFNPISHFMSGALSSTFTETLSQYSRSNLVSELKNLLNNQQWKEALDYLSENLRAFRKTDLNQIINLRQEYSQNVKFIS